MYSIIRFATHYKKHFIEGNFEKKGQKCGKLAENGRV